MIQAVSSRSKLFVLGDFNARVGQDHTLLKGIIGKQGVGSCNANGLHLLGLCAENDLAISNTFFRLQNRQKTTGKHPRSKHWTILDYILTRSRDLSNILLTRSFSYPVSESDYETSLVTKDQQRDHVVLMYQV